MHFSVIFLFTIAAVASVSFAAVVEDSTSSKHAVCRFFAEHGLENLDLIGCPASSEARVVDPSKRAELCAALHDGGLVNLHLAGCDYARDLLPPSANTTLPHGTRRHEGKKHKHHKKPKTEDPVENEPVKDPEPAPAPACSSEKLCSMTQNSLIGFIGWGCNSNSPSASSSSFSSDQPCNKDVCEMTQNTGLALVLFGCD
ncbi:hypothetical protein OC846_002101 [Tilletia horrida]|uniref:Hydrophobin n=1 Tax=Tilletia horrida TaxID=155126 RepID=A0AAN6GXR1_9BASI|nr:hypothetical protein OC846_002101 [Tilletia horrida]KAK0568123.1 hypothetical protein OC861_002288 [Tilletia horrida]